MIFLEGERDQTISSYPHIPSEFFEDMESSWKGRIKRIHLEEAFIEVEKAAELLSVAVSFRDFIFLMICRYCFCTRVCVLDFSCWFCMFLWIFASLFCSLRVLYFPWYFAYQKTCNRLLQAIKGSRKIKFRLGEYMEIGMISRWDLLESCIVWSSKQSLKNII